MDMRPSDLALLVSLNALLEENNVTRAAARLHISQPALSAQLARLRELFGDPLLVPSESGRGMVPTARALALRDGLRDSLRQLETAVRDPETFDPARAERTFRIAANDNVVTMFGIELARRIAAIGGDGLRLAFCEPNLDGIVARMARGELDLLIGAAQNMPPALKAVPLSSERYVMAQRHGHPRGTRAPTLKQFCALGHVMVSARGDFHSFLDQKLKETGHQRRVAISVPHYNLVPAILANTDYVCTLPLRFLQRFSGQLEIFKLPFELPQFPIAMAWHPRSEHDAAHRWLREQLKSVEL
ncbi:LysR family transcriptional regulator [Pseudoduganella violaceinigra]|uniref:LysR family transcriptional regulator n=1 Tax=Pseudoduganella violaceinigra TaxID=246602 RepID=UPI0003FE77AB|nr:LysR family transcriptional regulator [Pseudoduganella violaceinigra]